MSRYINPKNCSKEQFLEKWGILVPEGRRLTLADIPKGFVLVCLVNNGYFTAAGVIENEQELEADQDPRDPRLKQFFFVKEENLGDEAPRSPFEAFRRCAQKRELV